MNTKLDIKAMGGQQMITQVVLDKIKNNELDGVLYLRILSDDPRSESSFYVDVQTFINLNEVTHYQFNMGVFRPYEKRNTYNGSMDDLMEFVIKETPKQTLERLLFEAKQDKEHWKKGYGIEHDKFIKTQHNTILQVINTITPQHNTGKPIVRRARRTVINEIIKIYKISWNDIPDITKKFLNNQEY